jgi:hypothetical protein
MILHCENTVRDPFISIADDKTRDRGSVTPLMCSIKRARSAKALTYQPSALRSYLVWS